MCARTSRMSGRCRSSTGGLRRVFRRPATSSWRNLPACAAASARRIVRREPSSRMTRRRRSGRCLQDQENHCVVQIAPAVRVAVGEGFGYPVGTNLTKKLYALLRRLGFKAVFDTNFGADLTIMEESAEFVERFVNKKGPLPLITSCCPAWVDYLEKNYGDMISLFSSAKSPHEMVGVMAKTYYAQKKNIDPAKIKVISIMPCTAKKYEITRAVEMSSSGYQDVDVSLTTRELIRMIKQAGIDFKKLAG
jgi:iron only hydrogenase large subunit-like protein